MLVLLTGKSRISCSFLHGLPNQSGQLNLAHFENFLAIPESPENRAPRVDINSFGR